VGSSPTRPQYKTGLTEQEGQKLQQIVRRCSSSAVRCRRAMMLLASADESAGDRSLVAADEDTVCDVVHHFNEIGLACLDPRWAGGCPRLLTPDEEDFVVATGTTHPPGRAWQALHALVDPQARRAFAAPTHRADPHRPGGAALLTGAVELSFAPTYASWANPIEAHCGPLRQFTLANSSHPNHTVQTGALHRYLCWRNAHARHPVVLAAQRREGARIRSEKGIRWGQRLTKATA
jgi:hypothetical protein